MMKSVAFIKKEELYEIIENHHLLDDLKYGPTAIYFEKPFGEFQVVLSLHQGLLTAESRYFRYHYPHPKHN